MSSLIRRMQRSVAHTNALGKKIDARKRAYMGRGIRLGTTNPKDPCRTGICKTPKPWRDARKLETRRLTVHHIGANTPRTTRAERMVAHRQKMARKAARRAAQAR